MVGHEHRYRTLCNGSLDQSRNFMFFASICLSLISSKFTFPAF